MFQSNHRKCERHICKTAQACADASTYSQQGASEMMEAVYDYVPSEDETRMMQEELQKIGTLEAGACRSLWEPTGACGSPPAGARLRELMGPSDVSVRNQRFGGSHCLLGPDVCCRLQSLALLPPHFSSRTTRHQPCELQWMRSMPSAAGMSNSSRPIEFGKRRLIRPHRLQKE